MDEVTEPLANGAALPKHPATTTARQVVEYGKVRDSTDDTVLQSGLHSSEISVLMNGQQMALSHLYFFAVRNNRIYHTRPAVIIEVQTEELGEEA